MTFSDYLLDSVLLLLVLRQIREAHWDRRAIILPLLIVGVVGNSYLHSVPLSGNNLGLVGGLTVLGIVFGAVSAAATRVRSDGGRFALVKAGWISAGVWVASMGGRFAFSVWASHGGEPTLARYTVEHHLSPDVWTAALVLMALGEVITRVGVLTYRARRVRATTEVVAAPALAA